MSKRAWVIGAGFSKSLGGPLLLDLLSLSRRDEIESWYSGHEKLSRSLTDQVYFLYHFGRQFKEGNPWHTKLLGYRCWDHAEQFLEFLDIASESRRGARTRLNSLWNTIAEDREDFSNPVDPRALCATARRLIAAECSTFLEMYQHENLVNYEIWQPYLRWAKSLSPNDTIISFNYDRVVEMAFESAEIELQTLTPAKRPFDEGAIEGAIVHLKLHGSLDWEVTANGAHCQDPDYFLHAGGRQLGIATPGPTKHSLVSRCMEPLWDLATKRLGLADHIALIGYRFAEGDSNARARLLPAIRRQWKTNVDIVLGPDTHSPDAKRIEVLAGGIAGKPSCRPLPLYAQDYLAIFESYS